MSADAQAAAIPSNARARQLRACLLCSIIQSPADFRRNGCPNCEEIMQMKQSQDRVLACTTTHFEGVIAAIETDQSWVVRWQRTRACLYLLNMLGIGLLSSCTVGGYVRGMYAVRVKGRVPEDVEQELIDRNIRYRPRDQSEQD